MRWKNVVIGVLGLGVSGAATIKFMLDNGYRFISWDDSPEAIKNCKDAIKISEAELKVCNPSDPSWCEVDYLIASPGIPNLGSHKVINNLKSDAKVICDVELFYMEFPDKNYVGITGTNGKSTTTKLIEHIFVCNGQQAIACGNIGVPILSVAQKLLDPKPSDYGSRSEDDTIIVLELSSYQLELVKTFRPNVAVILNITQDHLDHHGSMEAYIEAKKRIFMNQTLEDYLILNLDDAILLELYNSLVRENTVNLIPISTKKVLYKGISCIGTTIYDAVNKQRIHLPKNKNLRGAHNLENIVAAYAATSVQKALSKSNFINAIKTYPGLAHRLQFLGEKNGIEFINDSKATNADSTEKALNSLKGTGDIYLIAGGSPKENGINSIREQLKEVRYAFLIGKAQDEFAAVLDEIKVPYKLSNTLDLAFKDAIEVMKAASKDRKKILLLSPACASFDQWKNFEKRGERFIELVQEEMRQ